MEIKSWWDDNKESSILLWNDRKITRFEIFWSAIRLKLDIASGNSKFDINDPIKTSSFLSFSTSRNMYQTPMNKAMDALKTDNWKIVPKEIFLKHCIQQSRSREQKRERTIRYWKKRAQQSEMHLNSLLLNSRGLMKSLPSRGFVKKKRDMEKKLKISEEYMKNLET